MADLGAEVIKIEPPGGDLARRTGPFFGGEGAPDPERSCIYLYVNANKKSVVLDLEKPEGALIFKKLVATADVLLREGDPDWFEEKGLGYEELTKENPSLILSSATPFGESGPYRDYAASPNVIAHMSGNTVLYPHGTGDNHRAPCMLGGNFEEYDSGGVIAVGVLAALHWRRRSGRGQYIENAILETRFMDLTTETVLWPVYGQIYDRRGETQRRQASLCFAVKDGYMCPFISQQKEFNNLAKVLGREDWLEEEWFNDNVQRRERCDEIAAEIAKWGQKYTKAEATEIMQQNRVPIGPVDTPADVVHSEQFADRGFFVDLKHPVCGDVKFPGRPFIMEKTPHAYETAAPLLGADSREVLTAVLGMTEDAVERLAAKKVI